METERNHKIGGRIGYQFLLKKLQAMQRIQHEFDLIDLNNDFFIVRLTNKEDYKTALLGGPWMIGNHYLHVQRWKPNFITDEATIVILLVWVRFPVLPVEFTTTWLIRAGNRIGKTLRVDDTTLVASRGKFARVCVENDLTKPLKAGYRLRERSWKLQHGGLHKLCFNCGRYGHRLPNFPCRRITPPEMGQTEVRKVHDNMRMQCWRNQLENNWKKAWSRSSAHG